MLTQEENVDVHALRRRGCLSRRSPVTWGATARRSAPLGPHPLTGERAPAGPDALAPFEEYARARLAEDPHLWASALHDELRALGYERSYPSLTRALRRRGLRARLEACAGTRGRVTLEIAHPPGEEARCGVPHRASYYAAAGNMGRRPESCPQPLSAGRRVPHNRGARPRRELSPFGVFDWEEAIVVDGPLAPGARGGSPGTWRRSATRGAASSRRCAWPGGSAASSSSEAWRRLTCARR
jgi:hypothetical protein